MWSSTNRRRHVSAQLLLLLAWRQLAKSTKKARLLTKVHCCSKPLSGSPQRNRTQTTRRLRPSCPLSASERRRRRAVRPPLNRPQRLTFWRRWNVASCSYRPPPPEGQGTCQPTPAAVEGETKSVTGRGTRETGRGTGIRTATGRGTGRGTRSETRRGRQKGSMTLACASGSAMKSCVPTLESASANAWMPLKKNACVHAVLTWTCLTLMTAWHLGSANLIEQAGVVPNGGGGDWWRRRRTH
mmetsp:Transcript_11060/g.19176  ORF Transcript_11060/g.19176 Transcript_11060/m.19176 type:complete len:242 (-) Transcript_11060:1279-2004(-)